MSDVLFNPKCASHVWKVAIVIDSLSNIFWTCPLAHGLSADVLVGKVHNGPRGIAKIMNLVPMMALIKAAYTPLCFSFGRINLTKRLQEYNHVHRYYRSRVEQLFGCLWH